MVSMDRPLHLANLLTAAALAVIPACILMPAGYHHSKQMDECIEECEAHDPEARCLETEEWDTGDTGDVVECTDCCRLMYSR